MVAPVTTAPAVPCGEAEQSRVHSMAVSSRAMAVGDWHCMAAFWSQVLTSQSAAMAAGRAAAVDKAEVAAAAVGDGGGRAVLGEQAGDFGGIGGRSGNGPVRAASAATASGRGATERALMPPR